MLVVGTLRVLTCICQQEKEFRGDKYEQISVRESRPGDYGRGKYL